MKKIILRFLNLLFIVLIVLILPQKLRASPPNCGYLNEPCCNFAGSPNSCKTGVGLKCSAGFCINDGSVVNPPTREEVAKEYLASPTCTTSDGSKEGIDTAIGCIPVGNLSSFAGFLLGWGVGIGGGIAFILIVISGFMIMTASGNPERLQAGKELMTSAIMGLIMLIFSVFILKIIGVDILQLPGIT